MLLIISCDDLGFADDMVAVWRAGQMPAHNTYRAHLMDNGVTLLDTRMDEPSA